MANHLYVSDAVKINTVVLGGTNLIVIPTNPRMEDPGPEDGSPWPKDVGLLEYLPRAMVTTRDIGAAIGLAWFNGLALTGTGFQTYARPLADASVRGAANSRLFAMATGGVIPRRIRAVDRQYASMDLEVIGTSATGTCPLVISTVSDALLAPTGVKHYTLGPLVIGAKVYGLAEAELDMGILPAEEPSEGWPWPAALGIPYGRAVLRFKSVSASQADSRVPVAAADGAVLYFREMAAGMMALTSGFSLTFTKASVVLPNLSAGGVDGEVHPFYDGTHMLAEYAVAGTIP